MPVIPFQGLPHPALGTGPSMVPPSGPGPTGETSTPLLAMAPLLTRDPVLMRDPLLVSVPPVEVPLEAVPLAFPAEPLTTPELPPVLAPVLVTVPESLPLLTTPLARPPHAATPKRTSAQRSHRPGLGTNDASICARFLHRSRRPALVTIAILKAAEGAILLRAPRAPSAPSADARAA